MLIRYSFIAVVFYLTTISCLDFGEDVVTTDLTEEQLSGCIMLFHIREDIAIEPVGLKALCSGIDDAYWFKFETDVSDPMMIFDSIYIPADSLDRQVSFYQNEELPQWWDTRNRIFTGGTVLLNNGSVMTVGYQQEATRIICYIFYHEM